MAAKTVQAQSSRAAVPRIAVVGAGVIGLSVGLCLLETHQNQVDLTIIADKFTPDTTSDHAGAIFCAKCPTDATRDTYIRRTSGTFFRLKELYERTDLLEDIGLSLVPGYLANPEECTMVKGLLVNERELSQDEKRTLGPRYEQCQSVFSGSTFFIKGSKYLPWLMRRIQGLGGLIVKQRLQSLEELSTYDVIINCTGLGARELVGDSKVFPTRGQIVAVRAPKVSTFFNFMDSNEEQAYALLHKDHALLGGTMEPHSWSTVPDPTTAQEILERCCEVEPGFKGCEVIGGWACLRPTRESGVRLEVEDVHSRPVIIHNYGHGSVGVVLSWGCALETVQLVQQCLRERGIALTRNVAKL